ncbi:MAG: LD-carboxypeptidase [Acidobacteria bacterium]|nr:LD-carboxypeptidase [Acidobacteriota bacterium]
MPTRRDLLSAAAMAAFVPLMEARLDGRASQTPSPSSRRPVVKPARLRPGDTVGLVIPSSANWDATEVDILLDALDELGLKGRLGAHVFDRRGYFAGRDEDRAADINAMFADPAVKAIHCIRGGWGAARLLPLLDWDTIAKHPKILQGYSDITALLLSLHHKTGLVTFHGPNGASVWNAFNVDWMKRVTWKGEATTFRNLSEPTEAIVQTEHRTRTITKGTARGTLLGGNLTVLTAILGSPYVPDFTGSILFVEDVQEAPYRIDRMLTQLSLAGILKQVRGVVWGTCSRCDPGEGFGSLTIPDVLIDHLAPLGVPAFHGAMIGHVDRQFTLPVGIEVELDATAGTLRMLEPAVI